MDPNQPNPGGQDGASDQPPVDPPAEDNKKPEGETSLPVADESSPTSPPTSDEPTASSDGAEQAAQPQSPGVNEPYKPSEDADNFAPADAQPQQAAEQSSEAEQPGEQITVNTPDAGVEESQVETEGNDAAATVAEVAPEEPPTDAAPVEVTAVTDSPPKTDDLPPEQTVETPPVDPVDQPAEPPVERPLESVDQPPAQPGTEVPATQPEGEASETAPQAGVAAPAKAEKKGFMSVVRDMEKAVLIAVAVVALLVMFAVLYFIFFSSDDTYADYTAYETYNGTLSSLNLENESSFAVDYPIAMSEDSGAASQISNWFLAADSAPNENGDEVVNSILDVRLDSQALLDATKEEELQLLENEEFIALLEQDLAKDLNDRFAVNNPEFTYSGTTTIGVDSLDGYIFDFNGTSGNPDPDGDNFVIIGRYYIGFSDEVRFSVAMLGQADYWNAGLDNGTWTAIIDSVDIN